jgi:hypothetical protein
VVLTRRIRPREALLPVIALAATVLGLISAYEALFLDAPYRIPITDFGRDLLGARAAQLGVNPYQTVGELATAVPDWTVEPGAGDYWIAHSPLSLALARGWLAVFGADLAERIAEGVQHISLVVLLGCLWVFGSRTWSAWHGMLIASATAMTLGFRSDAFWIQGASFAAMGLALVFLLERSGRRNIALVLLGVLIAWRPWLAPMALVLPGSHSSIKDGARVALAASLATLLALPWIGGWGSLSEWLFTALPANLGDYKNYDWNLSVTGPVLPAAMATLLLFGAAAVVATQRSRWPREKWPVLGAVVILALSPLVWAEYWLALVAILAILARKQSFQWALLIILLLAWPLSEYSGTMSRVTSYLGVSLLIVSLLSWSLPGGGAHASRLRQSPAGP